MKVWPRVTRVVGETTTGRVTLSVPIVTTEEVGTDRSDENRGPDEVEVSILEDDDAGSVAGLAFGEVETVLITWLELAGT